MPVRLMVVEIALQELEPRSDARAYLEVLLNGPRIARMTRIRGKRLTTSPGAPGSNEQLIPAPGRTTCREEFGLRVRRVYAMAGWIGVWI